MTRPDGLNEGEGAVMDALVSAVRAFSALPVGHPSEAREFTDAIHRLQCQLAARAMRRLYPEGWR